jgi:hypothetical protein
LIPLVQREGLGNECYLDESQPKLRVNVMDCLLIDAYPSQRVAWSSASPHFNPHGAAALAAFYIIFRILIIATGLVVRIEQVKRVRIVGLSMHPSMLT